MLSKAEEIHVNAPPYHPSMSTMSQYIYHNEKKKTYFGRYDNKTRDVEFYWVNPIHSNSGKNASLAKLIPIVKTDSSVSKLKQTLPAAVASTATTTTPAIKTTITTTSPPALTTPTTTAARGITKKGIANKVIELSDKDSLFEKLRIKDKPAGVWWWEQMMEGK
jgi:hypothetical protein